MRSGIPDSPKAMILGRGRTGLAAAALVDRLGGSCWVTDDAHVTGKLPESALSLKSSLAAGRLGEVDLLITSPGVRADHQLLGEASRRSVPVVSELEFASRFLEVPILAVTGTNGKSTTVSLLTEALRCQGLRVFAGGNLGTPLSLAVGEDIDLCVVEVSSFQLEWVDRFRPRAAALLNLAPDHLDRHGDMKTYAETKMRLFANMGEGDFVFFGPGLSLYVDQLRSRGIRVGSFGALGRLGGGEDVVAYDRQHRVISAPGWRAQLGSDWPRADYDFENAAAAAALLRCWGGTASAFADAAASFRPLPHRLAYVGTTAGVRFWDDSKATNPAAAVGSVRVFANGSVVLLAGGLAKGGDLGGLAPAAAGLKAVIAFGAAADDVAAACTAAPRCERAGSMRAAFDIAVSLARSGDEVLLAPACASFDEFTDYRERGRAFVAMVEELGGKD